MIDPVNLLERLGVNNFGIDYDARIIYLPQDEFLKVVNEFEFSPMCYSFVKYGWTWMKEEEDEKGCA